ncbi:MAG: tetratricopeptide repeat protein [Parasphingorhabdus sp.]|uniref:tetratricopeptide repeat protein n=1 Tax=Parasphingorhabdus sp. TaxID=2709688 RepID=UPI0030018999
MTFNHFRDSDLDKNPASAAAIVSLLLAFALLALLGVPASAQSSNASSAATVTAKTLYDANAAPRYNRECASGSAAACHFYGLYLDAIHKQGGNAVISKSNANRDRKIYFGKACDLGNGPSCGMAGGQHSSFVPTAERNYAKAMSYFVKGCTLNDVDSCFSLGVMNVNGYGTAKNQSRAFGYFEKACLAGSSDGCEEARLSGAIIIQSPTANAPTPNLNARILRVFGKGCALNRGLHCQGAAMRYAGVIKGTPKNPALARKYYLLGCKLDMVESCFISADMSGKAEGGPQNVDVTIENFDKACRLGDDEACIIRDRIVKSDREYWVSINQKSMDMQTVERAWQTYHDRQKEQRKTEHCVKYYGRTNAPYTVCYSQSYARSHGWIK